MANEKKSRIGFWSGIIAILVVVTLLVISIANKSDNGVPVTGELIKVQDSDQAKGSRGSSLVLIEYSDFQCPFCKTYSIFSAKLAEEFADDMVVVFRHFPLDSIHSNARLAAEAAEAAGAQDKFWPMHDLLFEKQTEWSDLNDPTNTFVSYAATLELNVEQFETDLNSQVVKNKVKNDYFGGDDLGIQGTPTFILNGEKINTPKSYDQFRKLIQSKLSTQ
jgi:protein-disulfide isomerase